LRIIQVSRDLFENRSNIQTGDFLQISFLTLIILDYSKGCSEASALQVDDKY
jgi:hypothetical protein